MDTITRQIAEYASSLAFEDLDTATVQAATQRLIDALGRALAAHDCELLIGLKSDSHPSP